jgi:hypothetical protein
MVMGPARIQAYWLKGDGEASQPGIKHCVKVRVSRVRVWLLEFWFSRLVRVSQSVSCRRECAEGEGPPEGREGTRNRRRPGGHLKETHGIVGEVHITMHALYKCQMSSKSATRISSHAAEYTESDRLLCFVCSAGY